MKVSWEDCSQANMWKNKSHVPNHQPDKFTSGSSGGSAEKTTWTQRTTRDPTFGEFPEPSSNLLYNSITYIVVYIYIYIYIIYTYHYIVTYDISYIYIYHIYIYIYHIYIYISIIYIHILCTVILYFYHCKFIVYFHGVANHHNRASAM